MYYLVISVPQSGALHRMWHAISGALHRMWYVLSGAFWCLNPVRRIGCDMPYLVVRLRLARGHTQ